MKSIRGFFCGSGADMLNEAPVVDRLLLMTGNFAVGAKRVHAPVRIAYLGTATYDLPKPFHRQTELLVARGCDVVPICVADPEKTCATPDEVEYLKLADIILVSGGNTLYAMRRWAETGIDEIVRRLAREEKTLLAGGSAGAICWFTSGHSDSADPTTFLNAMVREALGQPTPESEADPSKWWYIRIQALGLLPGLVCPHFDVTQSNGVRRQEDFQVMCKRHPTERGLGIDHWAALVLPGDGTYEVFRTPGKTRAAGASGASATDLPGVFVLDVVNGEVKERAVAAQGDVESILQEPTGPLVADPFERYFAMANPTPSSGSLVRR